MSDMMQAKLWAAVKAFLADERTGQITLNVNRGKVESLDLRERVKGECLTETKR